MTEWIEHAIEFCMNDHTEFDFGGDEDDEAYPPKTIQSTPEKPKSEENRHEIPTVKPTRVSYDGGKTWIDLTKKEEKPKVTIRLDD